MTRRKLRYSLLLNLNVLASYRVPIGDTRDV